MINLFIKILYKYLFIIVIYLYICIYLYIHFKLYNLKIFYVIIINKDKY